MIALEDQLEHLCCLSVVGTDESRTDLLDGGEEGRNNLVDGLTVRNLEPVVVDFPRTKQGELSA